MEPDATWSQISCYAGQPTAEQPKPYGAQYPADPYGRPSHSAIQKAVRQVLVNEMGITRNTITESLRSLIEEIVYAHQAGGLIDAAVMDALRRIFVKNYAGDRAVLQAITEYVRKKLAEQLTFDVTCVWRDDVRARSQSTSRTRVVDLEGHPLNEHGDERPDGSHPPAEGARDPR